MPTELPRPETRSSGTAEKPPVVDKTNEERKADLEAKLRKVRLLREKLVLTRGEVKGGDPAKQYCWVNLHESRRTYYEGMGWVLCKDPKVQSQWKREDGTHQRGDLILYEISRDMKEVIDLDGELRAVEALQSSKDEFLGFAATNRVPAQLQEV